MARRAVWWDEAERERRDQRAVWWRRGRLRLFALPDRLRARVREIWRTCPHPADPASFVDFLHQIAVGKLDPWRPPWQFHLARTARITRDPSTFGEAFRRIGGRKAGIGPSAPDVDESLYCGNLGSGILFLRSRLRSVEAGGNVHIAASYQANAAQRLEIEVRGACSNAELALIERLAQATETRPVVVQHVVTGGQP